MTDSTWKYFLLGADKFKKPALDLKIVKSGLMIAHGAALFRCQENKTALLAGHSNLFARTTLFARTLGGPFAGLFLTRFWRE